jgi:hypothetical protein
MELAFGNYLTFTTRDGEVVAQYQNFNIKETIDGYGFAPFGFGGMTVNFKGDNVDATLIFPNDPLTRNWATTAVQYSWLAEVEVRLLNNDDFTQSDQLLTYVGQVSEGGWDETSVNLTLNTVLDAVQGMVPARRLTKYLVGNLPTASNVSLQ